MGRPQGDDAHRTSHRFLEAADRLHPGRRRELPGEHQGGALNGRQDRHQDHRRGQEVPGPLLPLGGTESGEGRSRRAAGVPQGHPQPDLQRRREGDVRGVQRRLVLSLRFRRSGGDGRLGQLDLDLRPVDQDVEVHDAPARGQAADHLRGGRLRQERQAVPVLRMPVRLLRSPVRDGEAEVRRPCTCSSTSTSR